MRLIGIFLALIASATANTAPLDTQAIGTIAQTIALLKDSVSEYADAFRHLAAVLQDTTTLNALNNSPGSKEYQQALHTLRSDISRAQWLFYDDKTVSDNLNILAARVESAY